MLKRIGQYRNRRRAAAALGFSFRRSREFEPPSRILVAGTERELHLPGDHGTNVAFLDILLDDCYRLRGFPNNIASVLDVGAHVGLFSLAARMRFPRADIHAYEPNPEMLPFLHQQSRIGSFSVYPEAVGAHSGRVTIMPGEDSVHTKVVSDSQSSLKCTAFSDAVARFSEEPILVKLDCEGAEWEILSNANGWDRIAYLAMEYHLWAGYNLNELRCKLQSLGFNVTDTNIGSERFGILIGQRSDRC